MDYSALIDVSRIFVVLQYTFITKCLLVCHVPERYGYRVQSMDSAKLRCSRLEIVSKYRRINSQLEGATPQ